MGKKEIRRPLGDDDPTGPWASLDVDVERRGKKIVLPSDPQPMDYDSAIAALARKKEEENTKYDVSEFIPGAYWDAALALYKAMQRTYGWVTTQGLPSWFGRSSPDLITIRTGPGPQDVVQLPLGEFTVPNIENPLHVRFTPQGNTPGVRVTSSARRAEQVFLIELCNQAREILRLESIYRGQAIRLQVDDDGDIEFSCEPEFLDLRAVSEGDIIFTRDTTRLIETNLFTPIKKTTLCRQHRVPLKRGILLEGPYGCGKSLTARVAAKVASDNDWTFITLDRAQGLRQAIEFARLYQPAVIFAEDIDRVADREYEDVNDLVNTMDGILTKDVEIIVVLTTNFIEKIDRSLLRPGRFDAVIRLDAPDAEAVERLFRFYGGPLVAPDADLSAAATVLAGQIPATVREVVERAKLGMLLDERDHIEPDHLRSAAVGMSRHLELLRERPEEDTAAERLAQGLVGVLSGGVTTSESAKLGKIMIQVEKVGRVASSTYKAAELGMVAASAAASAAQRVSEQLDWLPRNGGNGAAEA